jgi:polyisoprenoid-binding protein YceI
MSFEARFVLALALAAGSSAFTATQGATARSRTAVLRLDPTATEVAFRLPGALHDTHGTFRLKQGEIEVDTTTTEATGLVVVDASSGETGNSARDTRMRDVVLETGGFPDICFRPEKIVGSLGPDGSFRATVQGTFTLHGTDHPVAFTAEGRLDGERVTATCEFTVPYVEWGLKDPSMLFLTVEKQVDIQVKVAGQVTWKTTGLEQGAAL